jgi:D-3-phosphoglycerate dehydrogenase
MKKKVLICDYVHDILPGELSALGFEVNYRPDIEAAEVDRILNNFSGVIVNTKTPMQKSQMDIGTNLEFIGRLGSGLDIIDLDYAAKKNISVISTPEGNMDAVGEHALGMLLSHLNKIHRAHESIKSGRWLREEHRGNEMENLVIGIIGFGHTGSAFARKLTGFKVRILAYDMYRKNWQDEFPYVEEVTLEYIQEHCDVISIHLPLTEETTHMINSEFFNACKKAPIIINTARGKNIYTPDLLGALSQGKIRAALLDVLENEKISNWSDSEKEMYGFILHHQDSIVTPHVAGWTDESKRKIATTMIQKISRQIKGK